MGQMTIGNVKEVDLDLLLIVMMLVQTITFLAQVMTQKEEIEL